MAHLRYHNQTGEILAQLQSDPANIHLLATDGTGLIEGVATVQDSWVDGDAIKDREHISITAPTVPFAPGDVAVAILTGLPSGCWVRVRGTANMPFEAQVIRASRGKVMFVPSLAGRYVVQVVGRYRASDAEFEVQPLDGVKGRRQAEVTGKKAAQLSAGFIWNGHRWDADASAQANLNSMASAVGSGMDLPQGFFWTNYDNVDVPIDGAGIAALRVALMNFTFATHAHARSLKDLIEAQDSNAAVMALDLDAGWPG